MTSHWNPRDAALGQILVNQYGEEAKVVDLFPDDPEYFAALEDNHGYRWASVIENTVKWKPKPPTP